MALKVVEVTIEGRTPLLQHRFSEEAKAEAKSGVVRRRVRKFPPEQEAEKAAYKDERGVLYVPQEQIRKAIINASKDFKVGRRSATTFVRGITIYPERISLGTKKYEIDGRPVVVDNRRVMRYRPKIFPWKLTFKIEYDDEDIPDPKLLKDCLEVAGRRFGIGDFRPERNGQFGKFHVVSFKKVKK